MLQKLITFLNVSNFIQFFCIFKKKWKLVTYTKVKEKSTIV
jgi:hypothetical protein